MRMPARGRLPICDVELRQYSRLVTAKRQADQKVARLDRSINALERVIREREQEDEDARNRSLDDSPCLNSPVRSSQMAALASRVRLMASGRRSSSAISSAGRARRCEPSPIKTGCGVCAASISKPNRMLNSPCKLSWLSSSA